MARARWTRTLAVGALLLGLTACGEDDDGGSDPVIGTFEVTSQSLSEMGCDSPDPLVDPAGCFACVVGTPFFKIKRQSLFGASFLSVIACEAATLCEDDEDPDTVLLGGAAFDRKEGDTWIGNAYLSAYGGATCSYTETEWRLTETDGGVELTRSVYRNTPESPSGMLGEAECDALTDSPPPRDELECDTLEVVLGAPAATP